MKGKFGWGAVLVVAAVGVYLGRCYFAPPPAEGPTKTDTMLQSNPALIDSVRKAEAEAAKARQNAAQSAQDALQWQKKASAYADSLKKLTTPSGDLPAEVSLGDCRAAFSLQRAQVTALQNAAVSCKARGDTLAAQSIKDSLRIRRLILRIDTLATQLHVEQVRPRPCRVDLLIAHVPCGKAIGGGVALGALSVLILWR